MVQNNHKTRRTTLSKRLIKARESAGMTQEDVAASGIISQSNLSKLENSYCKVDFLLLEKLAITYKVEISFFTTI